MVAERLLTLRAGLGRTAPAVWALVAVVLVATGGRSAQIALLVGLVKGAITAAGYSHLSIAGVYLLMLLVLVFRPRGLFGERILRFE